EVVRKAIKLMDTAARKGLIHKNNASRQKARLTKKAAQ
ncbi:30S ribosomal protein S20, partial [Microvirga sp. 3-52]|nr:30S ribosomal protein S20 [Microvirga sp. 3-52]